MSSPSWSAGIASTGTTVGWASSASAGATTTSVGQQDLDAGVLRLVEVAADRVELVGLEQALADLVALRRQEGEHHPAADQQLVGLAEQVVDDAELVGDLGAAEHHDVRPGRVLGEPAQHLDLGQHQAAGRVRQALRDVVHAGLLAVHDAEPVADERVAERGQLVGEARRARRRPCSSRPALKRTFSSSTTSPSAIASTGDRAPDSPTVSVAWYDVGRPSSSASRAATGASE